MAHEILEHDNVVLHRVMAWHGLGTVVQDAPTPGEALKIANLNWTVEQWPLYATNGEGRRLALEDHVVNVRTDVGQSLGVVTTNYRPIQNTELADFCELLAEQSDSVKVESAGSIRNGAKVWFLLKGESFSVRGRDDVCPYILVSNGHDGGTALRCTPTTVRVVCSNTLHMVIPQRDREGRLAKSPQQACFVANHLGDVKGKVEDAKAALGLYGRALDGTRLLIDAAAAKDVNQEFVQRFFLECYTRDFGPIVDAPKTKAEQKARDKSQDAYVKFANRFDRERDVAGATAWNACNAYTGWSQNDRSFWKDADKESDRRVASKLFGQDAERAVQSLALALTL